MSPGVTLHFDRELRILLCDRSRRGAGRITLARRAPLKDLVESVGVPHTEVGGLSSRGHPVGFGHVPEEGEEVQVRAPEVPVDVTRPTFLRPVPLKAARFLVDCNVERLGRLLRVAGFDTGLSLGDGDRRLVLRARGEGRVVLTRDRLLLMRKVLTWGRLIRSDNPWDQLAEVVHFFGLRNRMIPFTRCPVCNGSLVKVSREEVWEVLEPLTRRYYRAFSRCPDCGRIYWSGSHCDRILEKLKNMGFFDEREKK